jgi:small conductance mechanosensitive channel
MDWTVITSWLLEHGIRILIIIVIAAVLYYVLRHFVPIMIQKSLSSHMKGKAKSEIKKRKDTLSMVFIDTGLVIIIIIAVFMILSEIGVNIAPALAGLGVAGIAIGFGAQSLVKDLFTGLLILMENQFSVGDYVEVAGKGGVVQEVGLRRTVLRDLDGTVHSIPNGEITTASNYTKEWARINMNISVGYGEDLNDVIKVINRVCSEMAEDPTWSSVIMTKPEVLRIDSLGDSGIDIRILGETKPMQQWAVMGELRLRLKNVFDQEGIEIPWPHTKIYFGNTPDEIEEKKATDYKLQTELADEKPKIPKRRIKPLLETEDEGGSGSEA